MEHTPGPWWAENGIIHAGKGNRYCHVAKVRELELEDGDHSANARLIAASPGLLEACKKASQLRGMALGLLRLDPSSEEANELHAEMNNITAEIQAVIAEAEGLSLTPPR